MKWNLVAAAFLFLYAGAVAAQDTPPRLSITEAIRAAIETDPAVAATRADVDAARGAAGEAEAALKPHLDLSGSAIHYEEPMVVTPIHGFTPGQFPEFDETLYQSAVIASYLLYDGGASRARVRQARAARSAALASLDASRQLASARTANTFLTVLSQARALEAQDLRRSALQSELRRVKQLHEVGRAAVVEVLRVEAALANAAAEETITRANLDVAERILSRLTGLPLERTRAAALAASDLNPQIATSRSELETLAIESSPAVRQARERLSAQQAAIAFARAGNLPRLQAVGSLLQFGSAAGTFTTEWNGGAQLRWSVFDGGASDQRVAQARAAAERAKEQVRITERDARDAIDRTLAQFEEARATAGSLQSAVERFAEVVRIERLRLDAGVGTQTDYLRAEADLLQARAGLAAAQYRTTAALVELARLAGLLEPEWLEQQIRSTP